MTKISSMVVLLIALRRQIVARDKKKIPETTHKKDEYNYTKQY